jgi:TadE-like protein
VRPSSTRSERGQAVVEFALVIPILLLLLVGMVDFGRAIFYWFDLNGAANTGARYAVVNRYPGCVDNTCTAPYDIKFQAYVKSLTRVSNATVTACYRDADASSTPTNGDPVRVTVSSNFKFFEIVNLFDLNLRGRASLRLEQIPSRIGLGVCT